jgi:hypothetical protein
VNTHPPDAEVEGITRELEQYVAMHPTAADTAEGIARWWLDRAEQPSLSRVEVALTALVARGLLARASLPDGKSVYSARIAPRGR